MKPPAHLARRQFLRQATALALVGGTAPAMALAHAAIDARGARRLALEHTHTGEHIGLVYALDDQYLPQALGALNHFLRDHYSGEVGVIAPALLDQLHRLTEVLGSTQVIQVISGYRCATTNRTLRASRGGGVARRSLHMEGRAIDVRLPGVALADLRDAALSLRAGGVGYYPGERFVHLDTGAPRRW